MSLSAAEDFLHLQGFSLSFFLAKEEREREGQRVKEEEEEEGWRKSDSGPAVTFVVWWQRRGARNRYRAQDPSGVCQHLKKG